MGAVAALLVLCLGGAGYAAAHATKQAAPGNGNSQGNGNGNGNGNKPQSGCQLGQGAGGNSNIKHVIYLQFDNVHYNRDNPNVASDLEQMPHLYNFLKDNGTLFTNDHTILISHTAGGILSSLTGLYPDRTGQTITNGYDYYQPSGVPTNVSSFKYWNDVVDATNDTKPNMITDGGLNTPAPWVPFTKAGCDVGGVGTANIELENANQSPSGDITRVFGNPSPEYTEAGADSQLAQTDFVGIAIHCSQDPSSVCAGDSNAKTDSLPDEPGGYNGFKALFGAKYVDPAISGGNPCVPNTAGDPITDPVGNCGFPGFDGMLATNTLGYVEDMQESGVPVTYGYISDVHDLHVPTLSSDSYSSSATGPGEITHLQQLKAYDTAFEQFFDNLDQHGINQKNTLFVITVDEGDHFAGGIGRPQTGVDNLVYDHRNCTNLTACPSNQLGEVGVNIKTAIPNQPTTNYDIHFDDAPAVYLNNQPGRTDATARAEERFLGAATLPDPYVNKGSQTAITTDMADPVELKALHMINTDPLRTPTFVLFGNPDFFFQTTNPCTVGAVGFAECVSTGFAWNHGDIQQEIGNTWVGFVGPGIANNGVDSKTWTDHTNLRPTILSLVGLKDSYTDDGHAIVQAFDKKSVPAGLGGSKIADLENAYEQLNAPFGDFSAATLASSTKALLSGSAADDSTYTSIETSIGTLTTSRDTLATTIKQALFDATFNGGTITDAQASAWITQANQIIGQAQALPH
jgi:hypothetical protein